MVRMKLSDDDFDAKALDVEYEGPQFERYRGDIPPTGTILTIRITKMWWLISQDTGESQTKLIAVAEQNDGPLKEYNGLPTWETLTWNKKNASRYMPFLNVYGLTTQDIKRKMDVEPDDDNIGTPINSIGDWTVGSDDTLARIVIKKDYFTERQEWRSKIDWDGWLPLEDEFDEEEEEQPRRPSRRAPARSARGSARGRSRDVPDEPDDDEDDDADYDVEDEEYDDEEDEEEEDVRSPARSRRAASASSRRGTSARGASSTRSSARPAARSSSHASSKRANAAAARDRKTRGSQDEPPF
jgi:hypothetical protein